MYKSISNSPWVKTALANGHSLEELTGYVDMAEQRALRLSSEHFLSVVKGSFLLYKHIVNREREQIIYHSICKSVLEWKEGGDIPYCQLLLFATGEATGRAISYLFQVDEKETNAKIISDLGHRIPPEIIYAVRRVLGIS